MEKMHPLKSLVISLYAFIFGIIAILVGISCLGFGYAFTQSFSNAIATTGIIWIILGVIGIIFAKFIKLL